MAGRRPDLVTYEYRRDRREFLRNFTHCFWCGGALRFDLVRHRLSPTVDHRIEVGVGADPRDMSNWVPAHLGCNSSRSANVTRRRLVRSENW